MIRRMRKEKRKKRRKGVVNIGIRNIIGGGRERERVRGCDGVMV